MGVVVSSRRCNDQRVDARVLEEAVVRRGRLEMRILPLEFRQGRRIRIANGT
jgi:hypothetical protein